MSPTVVGDRVYAASCSGKVFALDRASGQVRWSFETGATFHGQPVVASGLLIIPSDAGFVYAFELASGEVRWKTPVPPPGVLSDLVLAGSTVAGLDGWGQLFSLDLATGGMRWLFPPDGEPETRGRVRTPLAAADRIFFAGPRGDVYAVDALSGEPLWKRDLGSPATTGLALAGESALLGTEDRHLVRLALSDGSVLARLELPSPASETPVVAPEAIILLAGSELLVAVDPALAAVAWSLPSAAGWSSPRPLVAGDTVIAGSEEGEVVAVRRADGSIAWRGKVSGVVRGMGLGEDALFIGTLAGTVYAYRPPSQGSPP